MRSNFIDMTGWIMNEHGVPRSKLTVVQREDNDPRDGAARWKCKCSCGSTKEIIHRGSVIRSGEVLSCGCLHLESIITLDTVSNNEDLISQWDYDKNYTLGFNPNTLTCGSHKKVWWKCDKGHSYDMIIKNKANQNAGCPYCSNHRLLKGYNDLETIYPDLAKEWNYNKNNGLSPSDVLSGSAQKVWWKCSEGHEWEAIIDNRIRNHGCPYCAGIRLLRGCNDLQTVNPLLAQQWHPTKNKTLTASDITSRSDKSVWWIGECGHEWSAKVSNRTSGNGCPICANKLPKTQERYIQEVAEINPDIEVIGQYINNNTPILHRCRIDGSDFLAYPHNILNGQGCPVCKESRGEKDVRHYLQKHKIKFEPQYKFKDCKRKRCLPFDFYLPDYNMCIEYDGRQHFEPAECFGGVESFIETQQNDLIKNKYCEDNNIILLRIRYDENINNILDFHLSL